MDPQQELFTELLLQLKKTEYDVYDTFLPPEDTPYPFIYLADSQQTDTQTKSAAIGNVYQTIHVWHNNPKQRGTDGVKDAAGYQKDLLWSGTYGWIWLDDRKRESADPAGQHNKDSTSAWCAGSGV